MKSSLLQAILRTAPRSVAETELTLVDLQKRRDSSADALAVADAALDQALVDQADGKVGRDGVAKAARAAREAATDYELAVRAVHAAAARVENSAEAEANAAENAAWDRLEELAEQRTTIAARLESALGYVAKSYADMAENNAALYALARAPGGRVRIDHDAQLLTVESLGKAIFREMQRLEMKGMFKAPPPYEDLAPLSVAYKTVASYVRELRRKFFA